MREDKLIRIIKSLDKGAAIAMGSSGAFARGRIKRLQCMVFYGGGCCHGLGTALVGNWGCTIWSYQTLILFGEGGGQTLELD